MPSVTRAIEVSHVTHAMSRVLYYCTSSVYLCWLKTINFNYPCIVTVTMELKAGFYTPVNRTHNSARCLAMYGHHCSQTISAFAIKACMLATKSHMLNFFEACDCNHWQPIMQDTKRFSVLRKKKEQRSKQKINNFRKVVVSNSIPHVLRDLHTSKYKRPRNKLDNGCLWKSAKGNSVCTSKQLRFVASTELFNENQAIDWNTLLFTYSTQFL